MQNRRGGNCSSYAPSVFNTDSNQALVTPKSPRPIGNGQRFSVVGKKDIGTPITVLNVVSSPSTILRRVVSIIVDSINGVLCSRARPHISKETLKGLHPPIAHGYSSATVARKIPRIGVCAPVEDGSVQTIFRDVAHSVRGAVDFCSSTGRLAVEAPARPRGPISKSGTSRGYNVPAIADALPHGSLHSTRGYMAFSPLNNGKPIELLTSKVFEFGHFRHLEKFTTKKAWQSVVKLIFGSYPSHASSILTCKPRKCSI